MWSRNDFGVLMDFINMFFSVSLGWNQETYEEFLSFVVKSRTEFGGDVVHDICMMSGLKHPKYCRRL